ncbi:methyltransferase [Halomarina ordinaria]|uniref:Methyltransferase n=1 Tax=Halomarina ordinaria TaxID=3033939 RepID=A0ABD5UD59_9EURY|nr:methyltransferase [Halomarina sp. PSRA2]
MPTQDRREGTDRELLLLLTARRTGVLDALTTSTGTAGGVARETGVEERAARLVCEALDERGFLRRVGGEYQPTNRLLGFLAKTDIRSIGRRPHELDALEAWLALPDTMRTGEAPARPPDWTANALGSRAARDEAAVRAAVTAAVHRAPRAERVLALADGPGRHAVEFARRGYDVTLLDAPDVVDAVAPALEHEAVTLVAGDPLAGDYPDAGLVFAEGLLTRYDGEHLERVFAATRAALPVGGAAVFVGAVRGETPGATLRALDAYATRAEGRAHAAGDLTDRLADAGFDAEVGEVPGLAERAVAGRAVD